MINLEAAFAAGARAFDKPRGDELDAHASDFGACKYDVWARRNSKPRVKRSVKTLLRLQKGLWDEEFVVSRLEAGIAALYPEEGWTLNRGLTIHNEVTGHTDTVMERAKCLECGAWAERLDCDEDLWACRKHRDQGVDYIEYHDREMTIERMLFDVKTTQWQGTKYKGYKPWSDEISTPHLLQIAGYSLELPKNPDGKHMPVAIAQLCRASNGFKQYGWFYPDEPWILSQVVANKEVVLSCTAPGTDPVEEGIAIIDLSGNIVGLPPEKYSCKYCDNLICSLNVNPDNMEIPA